MPIYMKYGTLKGPSTYPLLKESFEVDNFSWSLANGQQVGVLSLHKKGDSNSWYFAADGFAPARHDDATDIILVVGTLKPVILQRYTLGDAFMVSYQASKNLGDQETVERLDFIFRTFKLEQFVNRPDGSHPPPGIVSFVNPAV